MSYLPGLRASLVEAARERYGDLPDPQKRQRRRRVTAGAFVTALAAVAAIAVAAVALVALGHRSTGAPAASHPPVSETGLRRSAAQALEHLALPPGAVASGLVRGMPAELWSPSSRLAISGGVDVYRIWRLHETPDRVVSFIETHRTAGTSPGFESETAISSSPHGPAVVLQASGLIALPPIGAGIWRQLAVDVVRLSGGGSVLRVDSEAGWLMPLPASERIPKGVSRVALLWARHGSPQHLSLVVTKPARVKAIVSLFNSLPSARPGTGMCSSAAAGFVRFTFEAAAGKTPLAVAIWTPPCGNLGLTIGGRPSVAVMTGSPSSAVGVPFFNMVDTLVVRGFHPNPRRVSETKSVESCVIGDSASTGVPPAGSGAPVCTSRSASTH